jgi:hypothetical protein
MQRRRRRFDCHPRSHGIMGRPCTARRKEKKRKEKKTAPLSYVGAFVVYHRHKPVLANNVGFLSDDIVQTIIMAEMPLLATRVPVSLAAACIIIAPKRLKLRLSGPARKSQKRFRDNVQISGRFGSNPAGFITQRRETGRPIPIQMQKNGQCNSQYLARCPCLTPGTPGPCPEGPSSPTGTSPVFVPRPFQLRTATQSRPS